MKKQNHEVKAIEGQIFEVGKKLRTAVEENDRFVQVLFAKTVFTKTVRFWLRKNTGYMGQHSKMTILYFYVYPMQFCLKLKMVVFEIQSRKMLAINSLSVMYRTEISRNYFTLLSGVVSTMLNSFYILNTKNRSITEVTQSLIKYVLNVKLTSTQQLNS